LESSSNKAAEHFLDLIRRSRRGTFKIYIGMAAGVGKTYRMLTEAHSLQNLGVDVVIGFIETHGREETVAKLNGLPLIPRKKIFYKGKELEEMDIDAILARRPEVVIVDELAHTNIHGSRNEKRYHDVDEILNAGIAVISAVNIQHIESLNNVVEAAVGVAIHERVPDSVIKSADEVVNIDLTADELIQRLADGKIYKPDKVQTALANFFQKDNLLKLRELALREVANQVERKIENEVQSIQKKQIERLMVCVSTNHLVSEKLIRSASRLADRLDAYWMVLYVETPKENPDRINLALQRYLINNFKLATELGGEVVRVKGTSIAREIARVAREREVSKILLGRSSSGFWSRLVQKNILLDLIDAVSDTGIDIEIIS
jgi:two-component system, OmpR family, sensor histidine kinase KdpD